MCQVLFQGVSTKLFNLGLVKEMWNTVMKKRFGFLRSIIILSTVGLTLNFMIYLGKRFILINFFFNISNIEF